MALTITHTKVATIPDDPTAEVGTDEWNATHTVTGSPDAGGADSEVQYNNSGALDGDPALTFNDTTKVLGGTNLVITPTDDCGIYYNSLNPTMVGDSNFRRAMDARTQWNAPLPFNPVFAAAYTNNFASLALTGDNWHGGGTNAKTTFAASSRYLESYAPGQRFVDLVQMDSYGMGDAFTESRRITYAGGDINGDEGQGFGAVSTSFQQGSLVRATISSIPTQATINTTTTQVITGSKDLQTVTVADSTGASAGLWVVVNQEIPTGSINIEAVQIDSVPNGTSIRGYFRSSHASGVTITPAKVLVMNATNRMGEQRVMVNLDGTSYSTGTVSSISGGEFTGTGTVWTTNIVGGSALNIGAIALTIDDYSGSPFGAAPNQLRSWYQITAVTDNTHLGIFSFSTAGDQSYKGNWNAFWGSPPTTYTILPAARILRRLDDNQTLVLETSTHTWTVGDELECIICPYPDTSMWNWHCGAYTAGGTYRQGVNVKNDGVRKFDCGVFIGTHGSNRLTGTNGADGHAWNTGIQIWEAQIGILMRGSPFVNTLTSPDSERAALVLPIASAGNDNTDQAGAIIWAGAAGANRVPQIRPNTPNGDGLDILAGSVIMNLIAENTGINAGSGGGCGLLATQSQIRVGSYTFANVADPTTDVRGAIVVITNSTVNTPGSTIAGGGGNVVLAWCDGSVWKVLGA